MLLDQTFDSEKSWQKLPLVLFTRSGGWEETKAIPSSKAHLYRLYRISQRFSSICRCCHGMKCIGIIAWTWYRIHSCGLPTAVSGPRKSSCVGQDLRVLDTNALSRYICYRSIHSVFDLRFAVQGFGLLRQLKGN